MEEGVALRMCDLYVTSSCLALLYRFAVLCLKPSCLLFSAQRDQPEEADNDSVLNDLTAKVAQRPPDYAMFRLQMFSLLSRMESIAERRTKTLSPMLIAIYRLVSYWKFFG